MFKELGEGGDQMNLVKHFGNDTSECGVTKSIASNIIDWKITTKKSDPNG